MTRSAHSTRRRRRRLFRAVTVALAALALTMPTSALADWPASEKTSGLDTSSDAPAPITNEKLDDLLDTVPSSDERRVADAPTFVSGADDKVIVPVGAPGLYPDAPRVVGAWGPDTSRLDVGVQLAQVVRDDSGIDRFDAGIASALTLAAILMAATAALIIRKRRGPVGH